MTMTTATMTTTPMTNVNVNDDAMMMTTTIMMNDDDVSIDGADDHIALRRT